MQDRPACARGSRWRRRVPRRRTKRRRTRARSRRARSAARGRGRALRSQPESRRRWRPPRASGVPPGGPRSPSRRESTRSSPSPPQRAGDEGEQHEHPETRGGDDKKEGFAGGLQGFPEGAKQRQVAGDRSDGEVEDPAGPIGKRDDRRRGGQRRKLPQEPVRIVLEDAESSPPKSSSRPNAVNTLSK